MTGWVSGAIASQTAGPIKLEKSDFQKDPIFFQKSKQIRLFLSYEFGLFFRVLSHGRTNSLTPLDRNYLHT